MTQMISRRRVLRAGIRVPLAGCLLMTARIAGAQGSAQSCVEADEANDGLRKSLHYVEAAADAKMSCAGCSFFTATQSGTCGQCQIMSGSANPRGHCDSWSKRT